MRNNSEVIDSAHGLIHFPHLTMRVETALRENTGKTQPVLPDNALMILLRSTKIITAFVNYPSEWTTTGTLAPS